MKITPIIQSILEKDFDIESNRSNGYCKLKNVKIVGRNSYYPNCLVQIESENMLVSPYDEKVMSLNKTSFYDNNEYNENDINKIVNNEIKESVYFFIYNFDNYYHFIYDTLPYLINYFNLKKEFPDLKLLINYPNKNNKFYDFNINILNYLNINKLDYLIHNDSYYYSQMYISNSLTHGNNSNNIPHKLVYDFFNNISKPIIKNTPSKIYISRRTWIKDNNDNIGTNYTLRRKMVNEDKLVDILKSYGFVEVFAEDYKFDEKINLFSRATHIIGAIGGGMCNLLFSAKTTKSLCIVTPEFLKVNYRFKFSMENTNITYFYNCTTEKESNIPLYTRVIIKESGKIGEIIEYKDNKYKVNLSNNDVAGFSSETYFESCYFSEDQLNCLDNGLNSPYCIDLVKFEEELRKFIE